MGRLLILFLCGGLLISTKAASQLNSGRRADSLATSISLRVLPQNFYNQHLSFFCKKEVQIQKLTTIPVYFRLGSKALTDYLERKPNARKPNE